MKEFNIIGRACVMGWPVSHSLSPLMYGYWLKKYSVSGEYTTMAVAPSHLKDALGLLRDRGFLGCNLTMPLKEMALSMMDSHDESCLMSGAVNTITIENGKFRGYNSDGFGFLESLKGQISGWDGTRVVILGAGGAARGIVATLRGAGVKKFVFVNRTVEKAEKVAKQFTIDADICAWQDRNAALKDATLLVNCTSLGMAEQPPLDIDLSLLPVTAGVCDIIYRPLITPLLEAAKKRGNPVAEGLPMLMHQGRLGFGLWFRRDPEVTPELYKEMAEAAV